MKKTEKEFIQQERERIAFEERLDMGLRVWLNTVPPDRVLSALEPPILPPPTLAGREPRVGSSANPGMRSISMPPDWGHEILRQANEAVNTAASCRLASDPESDIVKSMITAGSQFSEANMRTMINDLWRAGYAIL